MALPRYGSKDQRIPVLDHRSAAGVPWPLEGEGLTPVATDTSEPAAPRQISNADRARTVMANSRTAVLSLLHDAKRPLGLVVPYALRDNGVPLLGCREGVKEVLGRRPSSGAPVSLAVIESPLTGSSSNTCGGVTMTGILRDVGKEHLKKALADYAIAQPADAVNIKQGYGWLLAVEPTGLWVTTADGGYEEVSAVDYSQSSPDPLAHVAPTLVAHLSSDQGTSLLILCRAFGDQPDATAATLSGIDQNGMDLLVTTAHGRESVRISFGQSVTTPEEVRKELSAMIRGARFKLGMG